MSKLGLIGQLGCFDEETDDFKLYVEQLEQYFIANEVENDKKVAVLLSVIGKKTYKLLRSLVMPKTPSEHSYEELTKTLQDHFKPAPVVIAERFRFHRRNQLPNESIADYIVELRRLASTCDFGTFLDDALRDRFVCGISNETTQKRLLAKKELKLSDATEIALATEIADTDCTNMKMNQLTINKVQNKIQSFSVRKNKPVKFNKDIPHSSKESKCFRCGSSHDPNKCKYKTATCHFCSKIGHIAPVCLSKAKRNLASARKVEASNCNDFQLYSVQTVNLVEQKSRYTVPVKINNKPICMELDTAADVSIVSECWLKKNLPKIKIRPTSIVLKDYNQSQIDVVGELLATVTYDVQQSSEPLIVVRGDRPALFGKNWISKFKLDWHKIFTVFSVKEDDTMVSMKKRYGELFQSSTSPIKHFKASLKLHKDATPVFCKARPVPYSLKNAVSEEIKQTEKRGVWKFVEHSKWATPVVVVPKKNNSVRLCGDFKVTVNRHLDPNQYPLPTQQDLFATLRGGKYFSKLDLSHAYQQIELDAESQELLTLNTLLGLVRPTRLLYGINSASAIFQSTMEQILQGIPNVICFQDDVLVSSATIAEHFSTLEKVLDRFRKYNVHLNADKCKFLENSVEFLGHLIDEHGVHPTQEKVDAIRKIKAPENVTELKSFLGLLNYYAKFIKNSSSLLAPLHELLNKDVVWAWTTECNEVFQKCKMLLTSDTVLAHYDERLPLQLSCDASPVGVGAVLSHVINGEERPVAYASRTLSKAESNYSQTEKEALSIIFGCKKFHQYLYGRNFILFTDHQPLVTIFAPDKAIPTLAAARLQRWALLLSSFKYTIRYKKGTLHQNADSLSRLPIVDTDVNMYPSDVFKISYLESMPITSDNIAQASRTDKDIGVILKYVQYGFPATNTDPELRPYFSRRDQLSVESNCLLWGMRVIIPQVHRKRMLDLLHDTHPGITKMKAVARSHFWWPNLDQDIENMCARCEACQVVANSPPATPLQSWIWPKSSWERIHIDYAQMEQANYLIVVDSYSKWLEVARMTSTTTSSTIDTLQQLFSRYGLPLELVSDNGPQFISLEFSSFLKSLGIQHTLIPAYHPQSNGLAERSVQTFKHALKKMLQDSDDNSNFVNKLQRFLLVYRSSPHSTTGLSPGELFLGRPIRTLLDFVHPCTSRHVQKKQSMQKQCFDRAHTFNRTFSSGQDVWVRSHRDTTNKWVHGTLMSPKGSKTWVTQVNGKEYLAHLDQLRPAPNSSMDCLNNSPEAVTQEQTTAVTMPAESSIPEISPISELLSMDTIAANESENSDEIQTPIRRSSRLKKRPDRLNL